MAAIIGAFAAGIVLDPVHFRFFRNPQFVEDMRRNIADVAEDVRERVERVIDYHAERHIEDLVESLAYFFVPIFFVMTGMAVRLETLFDPKVLLVALGITAVALVSKLVSGLAAGGARKWLVGWGMVPRGEVGLIFASIGKVLGVISDEVFSVIVIMVVLTTFVTPPVLAFLLKRGPDVVEEEA